nr:hypothetical protein [Methanobrevibacter gottschalkii]
MIIKLIKYKKGVVTAGDNWNDSAYDTVETPSELTYEFNGCNSRCSDFGATKEDLMAKAIKVESWNTWFYEMEGEYKTFQEMGLESPMVFVPEEDCEIPVDGIGDFINNGKGFCPKSFYDEVKEQLLEIALKAVEITVIDENGEDITSQFSSQNDEITHELGDAHMLIKFNNEIENVDVGDEVITTTSTFPFDNISGTFANDLNAYAEVDVEYISSDYSEYDERTCRDGGNYGYDYYIVTKIHEVGEL